MSVSSHDDSERRDPERIRAALVARENALRAQIGDAEKSATGLKGDCDLDAADAGVRSAATRHLQASTDDARSLLEQTSAALERLENGTYGVCVSCGEPVEAARLDALPHAAQCVACKESGSLPEKKPGPA